MIYLLLFDVVWIGLMVLTVAKVLDKIGDSLTAVVITGMCMVSAGLIGTSVIIDAIVEGRIPL